ncbi:MAG: hypothetical protein OXD30_06095, partial [Bryobacterales bacterium]|nr:hypothetical protein [Bryobacterales bacterium]
NFGGWDLLSTAEAGEAQVFPMKRSCESSALVDIDPAMRVEWDRQARADLAKLSKRDVDRIEKALTRLAEDRHGDIQRVRR